jgi:hypothetical protein
MGYKVRNVSNGRHRVTEQPLNLFSVDLEPAGNNIIFIEILGNPEVY